MAAMVATEDVAQLWDAFKADQDNQELRNRLVEMYLPLGNTTASASGRVCPKASSWMT